MNNTSYVAHAIWSRRSHKHGCINETGRVGAQDVVMPNLDGFEAAIAIRALEATVHCNAGNDQNGANGEHSDELQSRPTKQRRIAAQPAPGAGRPHQAS